MKNCSHTIDGGYKRFSVLFVFLVSICTGACGKDSNASLADAGGLDSSPGTHTDIDTDSGTNSDEISDSGTDSENDSDAGIDTDGKTDTDGDTDVHSCVNGRTSKGKASIIWVAVCGDTFDMGSLDGNVDEQPVHTVTMPDFELLKTEVTVSQFSACVKEGACKEPGGGNKCNWDDTGYENHPLNCVNWQQAVDYCTWTGGRLPSEAEWEFAARSRGRSFTYPWGNDTPSCDYAVMEEDGDGCGTGRTIEGCEKTNGNTLQELCDMSGNVWEWVQDWYHSDYEDEYNGPPVDGGAWEKPAGTSRVRRGGSFYGSAVYLRVTGRGSSFPGYQGVNLGFRCAR